MTLTDKEITLLYCRDYLVFARTIEARVLEELRKQEPFCYLKEEWLHYEQSAEGLPHAFPVYAAPIPSTRIKDFSELRDELDAAPIPSIKITNEMAYAFHRAITDSDLGSDDVAEIKKGLAAALANYAVPIPPTVTPSQQKVLSAVDTLLATFDSGYHPELNLIRNFMLARPDAPIPTTGETK